MVCINKILFQDKTLGGRVLAEIEVIFTPKVTPKVTSENLAFKEGKTFNNTLQSDVRVTRGQL